MSTPTEDGYMVSGARSWADANTSRRKANKSREAEKRPTREAWAVASQPPEHFSQRITNRLGFLPSSFKSSSDAGKLDQWDRSAHAVQQPSSPAKQKMSFSHSLPKCRLPSLSRQSAKEGEPARATSNSMPRCSLPSLLKPSGERNGPVIHMPRLSSASAIERMSNWIRQPRRMGRRRPGLANAPEPAAFNESVSDSFCITPKSEPDPFALPEIPECDEHRDDPHFDEGADKPEDRGEDAGNKLESIREESIQAASDIDPVGDNSTSGSEVRKLYDSDGSTSDGTNTLGMLAKELELLEKAVAPLGEEGLEENASNAAKEISSHAPEVLRAPPSPPPSPMRTRPPPVPSWEMRIKALKETVNSQRPANVPLPPKRARTAADGRSLKSPLLALPDGRIDARAVKDDGDLVDQLRKLASSNDARKMRSFLTHPDPQMRVRPDVKNEAGETLLLVCARQGRVAACAALLDAGADPLARDGHPNLFGDAVWPDEMHPDALGVATRDRRADSRSGMTAVYHLRLQGVFDEVLSQTFPMTRLNLMRAISEGLEAFHLKPALVVAARKNNPQLMSALLKHMVVPSADSIAPTTPQPMRFSPRNSARSSSDFAPRASRMTWRQPLQNERAEAMYVACMRSHWTCAKELLSAGGFPAKEMDSKRDKLGRTVLHIAAIAGDASLVRMMLEAKFSHQITSNAGRQPIHDACAAGHVEVVNVLLQVADPSSIAQDACGGNEDGRTPLQLALAGGHHRVASLLKAHGVKQ